VPRPLQANAAKPTKYGVIYFGSTSPAMDEAIGILEARGHQLDRMRIRSTEWPRASIIAIASSIAGEVEPK
jgi:hypothetical protein